MAWDIIRPTGSSKASRPESGGANTRDVPMLGIVKDNVDPIRAGRLQIYLADFGGKDSDDDASWTTVSYMSPFFGATLPSGGENDEGSYTQNPSSYGMWNSPPDIGSTVVCVFINGDPNYGYYIGCVPDPDTLYMVPAVGCSDNVTLNESEAANYGGATRLPVTNLNTNNTTATNGSAFLQTARPVHSYAAGVLMQQGLIRDPIRGAIGTTSQRESPSRVGYGVSTPGRPVFEGGFSDESITSNLSAGAEQLKVISRRGGHTFIMDDGDINGKDQLVRLRTATGHQILMSDDGQCLFIVHANGSTWIELGKEGTIDLFASNSVNIRTQGDLNLHADNNININAAKTLNVSAETINTSSDKNTTMKVGVDFKQYTSGKYTVKVAGGMSMSSSGEASYASSNITYINGSKVNLNSGSTSIVPESVPPIPLIKHTDTLRSGDKGFVAAPGKLSSIVSRAPAHQPWVMAGQGVDVKTDDSLDANLPAAPAPAAVAANAAASAAGGPIDGVKPAVAATVPSTSAISGALDKNATGTLLGQAATMAASGPAAAAAKLGAGIVGTGTSAVAAIGAMGASLPQLEAAGVLKTGAAALGAAAVAAGQPLAKALPSNLFAGTPGGENLQTFAANPLAQVAAQVTSMQKAQTALTGAGIMTGKESSTQVGGMILAATATSVATVTNLVKNPGGAVTGATSSVLGSASKLISSGNFAAGVASTITGGMSSIAGALGGAANAALGVVGSAVAAITSSWKAMRPGVPQNLTAIAKANSTSAAVVTGAATGGLTSVVSTVTGGIPNINSAVSAASKVTGLSSTVTAASAGIASGVNAIPGGPMAVSSLVNAAKGAIPVVPGVSAVTSLIGKLPGAAGLGNLAATAVAGLGAGPAALLNSAMSGQGGGGASPEKLVTSAINTNQTRPSMDAALKAVLGGKVDPPGYSGNPAAFGPTAGTAKVDKIAGLKAEETRTLDLSNKAKAKTATAIMEFNAAKVNLPAGDPEIERLRLAALVLLNAEVDAYVLYSRARDAVNDAAFFG